MWVPRSKFFSQFISCLGIGVCPCILLYKKMKKMGGVAMVTILSSSTRCRVSTLNVLLLTLNKALPGGRPTITRFMLMPISLWIKLNHVSCFLYLSLYICSGLNVWRSAYIHRPFKSSMVFGLKCLLRSNWHGVGLTHSKTMLSPWQLLSFFSHFFLARCEDIHQFQDKIWIEKKNLLWGTHIPPPHLEFAKL